MVTFSSWKDDFIYSNMTVYFCGFKSTMLDLRASGWTLQASVEKDMWSFSHIYCISLVNENLRLAGMINDFALENIRNDWQQIEISRVVPIKGSFFNVVGNLSIEMKCIGINTELFDAHPELTEDPRMVWKRIPFEHAFTLKEPDEVIIQTEDVSSMLTKIIEEQRVSQAELREKARNFETPCRTTAKILSFCA